MTIFNYTKKKDGETTIVEFPDMGWTTQDGIVEGLNGEPDRYVGPDEMALDLVEAILGPYCDECEFTYFPFDDKSGVVLVRRG